MKTNISDITEGDLLVTDGGFTCISKNQTRPVKKDEEGLFINCLNGKHYLNGQTDDQGNLVGLSLK